MSTKYKNAELGNPRIQLDNPRAFASELQSTLVISKSKGPATRLRDIRTSTYQICSIEEKTIRTTKFHK